VTGNRPPSPGDSWGYSAAQAACETNHEIDGSWVAQTDLVIYHLPMAVLTIAKAFTPDLDNTDPIHRLQSADQPALPSSQALKDIASLAPQSSTLQNSARQNSARQNFGRENPTRRKLSASESSTTVLFPKPPRRIVLDAFRRYPWVEQQSSSDCAAACLSMVARYWGKRFPLHVLRERANIGRSGASLKSLATAAEGIGFQARPVRASVGALANQKGPWIAHWEGIHYIVVYKITAQQVTIADPALGRQVISRQQFDQQWTGYGLLLEPTDQLQETEVNQASLDAMSRYCYPTGD